MTAQVAIGVGCRRGCPGAVIVALVRQTLATCPAHVQALSDRRLFTIEDKRDEPGLRQAADDLALALVFLSRGSLAATEGRVTVRSAAVQARFGLASVAEAAALAGAGGASVLVAPRTSAGGATCAVAVSGEENAA